MTTIETCPVNGHDDAELLADWLWHIVDCWSGDLAPCLRSGLEDRARSAALSVTILLDGQGGVGPLSLKTKGDGGRELAGRAFHEHFGSHPDEQAWLQLLETLVNRCLQLGEDEPRAVLTQFITDLCRELASRYELRLVAVDELGFPDSVGPDIAAQLKQALTARIGGA